MDHKRKARSEAHKLAEGSRLKYLWLQKKDELDLTQESLCNAIGLNQGMLQQMFTGKAPIPQDTLIDISILLDVDPRQVRPEIQETMNKMLKAFRTNSFSSLNTSHKIPAYNSSQDESSLVAFAKSISGELSPELELQLIQVLKPILKAHRVL